MSSYNKYYQKEKYFGNPYPELISFFLGINRKKKILDLGCGQGRDSIALGRLGFSVTGIDISSVGIKQMNEIASKEALCVKGIVSDYKRFENISDYDVVLLDSMFHFYKKDIRDETESLVRIIANLKVGGIIVLILQKSKYRIEYLKKIIKNSIHKIQIDYEESFMYQEFNSAFYMISIKKHQYDKL